MTTTRVKKGWAITQGQDPDAIVAEIVHLTSDFLEQRWLPLRKIWKVEDGELRDCTPKEYAFAADRLHRRA